MSRKRSDSARESGKSISVDSGLNSLYDSSVSLVALFEW